MLPLLSKDIPDWVRLDLRKGSLTRTRGTHESYGKLYRTQQDGLTTEHYEGQASRSRKAAQLASIMRQYSYNSIFLLAHDHDKPD